MKPRRARRARMRCRPAASAPMCRTASGGIQPASRTNSATTTTMTAGKARTTAAQTPRTVRSATLPMTSVQVSQLCKSLRWSGVSLTLPALCTAVTCVNETLKVTTTATPGNSKQGRPGNPKRGTTKPARATVARFSCDNITTVPGQYDPGDQTPSSCQVQCKPGYTYSNFERYPEAKATYTCMPDKAGERTANDGKWAGVSLGEVKLPDPWEGLDDVDLQCNREWHRTQFGPSRQTCASDRNSRDWQRWIASCSSVLSTRSIRAIQIS